MSYFEQRVSPIQLDWSANEPLGYTHLHLPRAGMVDAGCHACPLEPEATRFNRYNFCLSFTGA